MGLDWFNKEKTTRSRSGKQESKIAKDMKGNTTINSGATFGQNDVITDYCEVEAKTTNKNSFRVTKEDFDKLVNKTKLGKLPIMVIDLEKSNSYAVLLYSDLQYLINKANDKT